MFNYALPQIPYWASGELMAIRRQRYTAKQVIEALTITRGMVYMAAEKLGCDPKTVYNYIDRYESVKEALDGANGRALDKSETALMKQIEKGNIIAIKYHLSTKGKHRGYTAEVEVDVTHRLDSGIAQVPETIDAEFWDESVDREIKHVQIADGTEGEVERQ